MVTLLEAHGKDASYWGDYPDWIIVHTITRDSDLLARSNWESFINELNGIDTDTWAVERSNHWAVGWVDYLAVAPGSEAQQSADQLNARIEEYPVLDEEAYSAAEWQATADLWDEMTIKDRIDELAYRGECIFAARATARDLYDRAPATYEHIQLSATE